MFGFEQFLALNRWLTGLWRLAWLNVLWSLVTALGLGVLGLGPASYALAKYLDGWFRHGETPPVAPTFLRSALELRWQPVLTGLALSGAAVVILVNLVSLPDWYLRAANVAALGLLWIVGAHVFIVMAALDVTGLRDRIVGALLLGIGSLHWTIIGTAVVVLAAALMLRFALPLLVMFGAVLPAAVFAAISRRTLRDLEPGSATGPAEASAAAPQLPVLPAERTDAFVQRPPSASVRATTLQKGNPR